jgi:hypothetical protein
MKKVFSNLLQIPWVFAVEDIEALVAKLKKKRTEIFSEIQHCEESYKLCYVRGPEGIILELAEQIT